MAELKTILITDGMVAVAITPIPMGVVNWQISRIKKSRIKLVFNRVTGDSDSRLLFTSRPLQQQFKYDP